MSIEDLIKIYWKSWQSHSDWNKMRNVLSDDFEFDAGFMKANSAEEIVEIMKNGNPWKEIKLLEFEVKNNKGFLVYEGIDTITEQKIRIAEMVTVEGGKISKSLVTIAPYPNV